MNSHRSASQASNPAISRSHRMQPLKNLRDRFFQPHALNRAGKTPYEVIAEQDIVQLRYYPPTAGSPHQHKPPVHKPLVIVPPLAVNMFIYDLFPDRSLVSFFRDQGYPLYLIDWGRPTRKQAHYRFRDYLQTFMPQMLERVREHSGERQLTLHGWSLGAMFCYSYTALGDSEIDRLVLLGPPCDYHAKGMKNRYIAEPLKRIEKITRWEVHKSPQALWHIPGWANALGFKLMSPAGTFRGHMQLLRQLGDQEFVANHATNAAFLDDMVAYPGGVAQDIMRFLVTDNVLAKGRLPIRDCEARLRDVKAKILIVVGDKDPIVTPAASKQLMELMPDADCELLEVPGGHMSIVSGSRAPVDIWPNVADWLAKTASKSAPAAA